MSRATVIFLVGSACVLIGLPMLLAEFCNESDYPDGAPVNVILMPNTQSQEALNSVNSAFNVAGLLWCVIGVGVNTVAIRIRNAGK